MQKDLLTQLMGFLYSAAHYLGLGIVAVVQRILPSAKSPRDAGRPDRVPRRPHDLRRARVRRPQGGRRRAHRGLGIDLHPHRADGVQGGLRPAPSPTRSSRWASIVASVATAGAWPTSPGADTAGGLPRPGVRACPGPGAADALHAHPRPGQGGGMPRSGRRLARHRHVLPEDELGGRGRAAGRTPGARGPVAGGRLLRGSERGLRAIDALGAEAAGLPGGIVDTGRLHPPLPHDRLPHPGAEPGGTRAAGGGDGAGGRRAGEARGAVPGTARGTGPAAPAPGAARRARGAGRAVLGGHADDGLEQLGGVGQPDRLGIPDPRQRPAPRGEPPARGLVRGGRPHARAMGHRRDDAGAARLHRGPQPRPRLGRHLLVPRCTGFLGRALPRRRVLARDVARRRSLAAVPHAHRDHPAQGTRARRGDLLGERPRRARRRSPDRGDVPRHPVVRGGFGSGFDRCVCGHVGGGHGRGRPRSARPARDRLELGVRRPEGVDRIPAVGTPAAPAAGGERARPAAGLGPGQ